MTDASPPTDAVTFDGAVVAAVTTHMNGDHPDDTLLICRHLGGRPTASAATMVGFDGDGGDYVATVDGTQVPVRIPWSAPVVERADVRREVVVLYNRACEAAGIEPRPH